jgi:YD repeat-containing protein
MRGAVGSQLGSGSLSDGCHHRPIGSAADGATTSLTYDLTGRKTQMTDPDMGTWYYGYDDLGNLKHQIDAVKPNNLWRATCFYYDGHNRLRGKTYPTGIASPTSYSCPADPGVYPIRYSYDAYNGSTQFGLGRRTAMSDTAGSAAWVYDQRGRVISETKVISGTGGGAFVSQWGYDSADRIQSQTYPGGSAGQLGEQVNYTYNPRGLLKTIIGASVYVSNTWYNPAGQVTDRMLGSAAGVRQNYSYSQANNFRLTTLKSGAGPGYDTQQNLSYAYDAAGNVRAITDTATLWGGQQVQSFGYYNNALNQVWTAQAVGGAGSYPLKVYEYNPAGNLTQFEGTPVAYNDAAHRHAATHVGGAQRYWYDANGNVITRTVSGVTLTLAYDAENRLISVGGTVTEAHTYDGDGVRVKAVVSGTTSVFVGAYYEMQGSITKTYYYAGAVRVAERNGGVLHWLLTDHLGGTHVTLRADGTFSTTLRYMPYGYTRYNPGGQITTLRLRSGQAVPLHRAAVGQRDGVVLVQLTVVRSPHRPLHPGGYHRAAAGQSAGAEQVLLCSEFTAEVHGSHRPCLARG